MASSRPPPPRTLAPSPSLPSLSLAPRSATYGDRRGAAFGLAGMVAGLGIGSLRKYNVMTELQAAAEGNDPVAREARAARSSARGAAAAAATCGSTGRQPRLAE